MHWYNRPWLFIHLETGSSLLSNQLFIRKIVCVKVVQRTWPQNLVLSIPLTLAPPQKK